MLVNGVESKSRSHRSGRRARGAWRLAEVALGLVAVFCPLAIATVHPWAVATAAGLALVALGCCTAACWLGNEPFQVPAPGIILALITGYIAFQLVPLPPALLGLIAPHTGELFRFVLAPLGHYPAWRPLSLDPPATANELVKAVTYLAVFLAAAQVARSRRARTRIMMVIGVTGLLVALIGFAHAMWGATALFGRFSYQYATSPLITTFGNSNHLASLLSLSATLLLTRVLTERDRKVATLWAFGYLATGVGVLLSLSRGGIVSFLVAQIMLGVAAYFIKRSEREGQQLQPRQLAVPAILLLVLAMAGYIAWDALMQEWATVDSIKKIEESKIALWPKFLPLVKNHWLTGVGRGAFQPAYQHFQESAYLGTLTHPESIVFQWTSEIGVPLGLFFLVGCGWSLVAAYKRHPEDIERVACMVALAALVLHDLVDFGLELGGLAVPATVVLAVATSAPEQARRWGRKKVAALIPVVAVVVVVCLVYARGSLESDADRLQQKYGQVEAGAIAQEAVRFARRHPADYFPHLLAAQAYALERPLKPEPLIAFASRAMYLSPSLALPHRLAAFALRATGHKAQALIEYRLAYQLDDHTVLAEVSRVYKTPEEMKEAVPQSALGEPALAELAEELNRQKRYDQAEAIVRESFERYGEKFLALQQLAYIANARSQPDELDRVGVRMMEVAPNDLSGLLARSSAAIMKHDLEGALKLLEDQGLKRFPADSQLLLNIARIKLEKGDFKGCRQTLKRLPAGLDINVRLTMLEMQSNAEEREGHGAKAAAYMRSALALRPDDAYWQWRYALVLERIGNMDQAVIEAKSALAKDASLQAEVDHLLERAAAKKQQMAEMRLMKDVSPPENTGEEETP